MDWRDKLDRHWHWICLIVAVLVGAYLRILNPWDSVLTSMVKFSGNDPWYYYRIIQNLLAHFPQRIWFDAFTNYPYGTGIHFGPFVVYLGAVLAKLFGATTPNALRSVLAFVPAIGGILLVFPSYLLAREVFSKRSGAIAALLVVMVPGQLLHRSILGFNDHHIWEVVWMTATLALFAYSVNKWKGKTAIENLKGWNVMTPVLTGLAIGMYLYSWAPGFIIVFIMSLYALIAYLLKYWINIKAENIAFIGIISFLTAALIYLPFAFKESGVSFARYTPFPLMVLLGASVIMTVFYCVELIERKGYYSKLGIRDRHAFPVTVAVLGVVVVSLMSVVTPTFLQKIVNITNIVQKGGGALTVAEIQPFFTMGGGQFSLFPAWSTFAMTFFFAIPGIIYLMLRFVLKDRNNLYLLAVVWGVAMLIALAGQNRFAYYFGAVSAVFAGIMVDAILRRLRVYNILSGVERVEKVGYKRIALSVLILLMVFYPTFTMANQQSQHAGGMPQPWFDTLTWMRNNTPDTEFYDQYYYQVYDEVKGSKYPYPQETYGVMSWWDYGHWITTVAHRIPNANPFQQGIGSKYKENDLGAAPFFTAFNESKANNISEQLGVKYVLTDVQMATGKFYAMGAWAEGDVGKVQDIYYKGGGYVYSTPKGQVGIAESQYQIPSNAKVLTKMNIPSKNYYRTMEAKFHIFDGDGLENYRMIYESNYQTQRGLTMEILNRLIYNRYYAQQMEQDPVKVMSTGYVKLFERVDGVTVTGETTADKVTASATIKTNQGRTFMYRQTTDVDEGRYKLVLPYAQETKYPVKPSPYHIKAGNYSKKISVSDESALNNRTINIDLEGG